MSSGVPEGGPRPYGASLASNRAFALYLGTLGLSNVGTFMQALGVPFVLHRMTHSAAWVGWGGFSTQIAALAVTPVVGTLMERADRRLVLLASQLVQLVAALVLWWLARHGELTPWRMLACLAVSGVGSGTQHTSAQAVVAGLVPREQLAAAVRAVPLAFNVPRALGPAIAGLVLREYGVSVTFAVNAVSFVPFIVALACIRERRDPASHAGEATQTRSWWRDTVAGWRYVRTNRRVNGAVTQVLAMSCTTMAVLAHVADIGDTVYGAGPGQVGLLAGAVGLGALLASVAMVVIGDRRHPFALGISGLGIQAAGALVVAASRSLPLGLAGFFLLGVGNLLSGVAYTVVVQLNTADEFRARASSLFMSSYLVGVPIGAVVLGVLGDAVSLRLACALPGVLLGAYAAVVWRRYAEASRAKAAAVR